MAFTPLHATISQFTHRIVGHWGSSPLLGTAKAMWLCPRVEFKSSAFTIEATRWLIIVGGLLLIAKDGVFLLFFGIPLFMFQTSHQLLKKIVMLSL